MAARRAHEPPRSCRCAAQWDILKMSGIPEDEIAQVGGAPRRPGSHAGLIVGITTCAVLASIWGCAVPRLNTLCLTPPL